MARLHWLKILGFGYLLGLAASAFRQTGWGLSLSRLWWFDFAVWVEVEARWLAELNMGTLGRNARRRRLILNTFLNGST